MVHALRLLEKMITSGDDMSRDLAMGFLSLSFSEADKERYLSLAERHNNGELSAEELKELEGFVDLGTFLTLVQSKARRALRKQPAA